MTKKSKRQIRNQGTPPLCRDCGQPGAWRAKDYPDWKPGQMVFPCGCEYLDIDGNGTMHEAFKEIIRREWGNDD